jgi:2-deoxy-D-gluconate 3-dehydrogenase
MKSDQGRSTAFDLTGKAAIVTGAGRGIGRSIALAFAGSGVDVFACDSDASAADGLVAEASALPGRMKYLVVDVADVSAADSAMRRAQECFGRLDILVNNAAVNRFVPALEISEALWDRTLAVNLKSVMFWSQAAAKVMVAGNKGGRIINLASGASSRPFGQMAHYDASKAGVEALTRALAVEFAPCGIRVNAIAPGIVRTPGMLAMGDDSLGTEQVEILTRALERRLPTRRLGRPEDVAAVALFLASAAADYMVGQTLQVDGGLLLA